MVDDLDILINLFLSALLEKSIIIVGNNLKEVTGMVMGLKQLLRPLNWCCAIVPIVPSDLIDTVEAPIPILAGVTQQEYDELVLNMSE